MDSDNRLRQELAELNLLLRGLAQIPTFPTDLLELISIKVESISQLTIASGISDLESSEHEFNQPFLESTDILFSDFPLESEEVAEILQQISETPSDNATSSDSPLFGVESSFSRPVTRINDRLEQRRIFDLTKSLTLNDRFRFQREFFGNDSQKMFETFSMINKTQSVEEALDYLRGVCVIDEASDSFQDFCLMLNLHFTSVSNNSMSN